jgi:hypothetical protein
MAPVRLPDRAFKSCAANAALMHINAPHAIDAGLGTNPACPKPFDIAALSERNSWVARLTPQQ